LPGLADCLADPSRATLFHALLRAGPAWEPVRPTPRPRPRRPFRRHPDPGFLV